MKSKEFRIPGLILLAALAVSCGDMYSEMDENARNLNVDAPAVMSVAPINGEPDTLVNLEIAGTGFQAGAAATLAMTGLEIPADGEIVSGGTKISCSIDLTGAALGKWSVVVTNPDGVSSELANAFEVSLTHSVTYDANGGAAPPSDPNSYFSGDTVTVLGQGSMTRAGYDFADWMDTASGTVHKEDDTFIMPASDVTLTAQWTAKEYTVTFDAEGGDVPDPLSKTVTFDSPYGPLATTGRNGYTFTGWWTGVGGTGTEITAAGIVSTPSDHTLYAGWNEILYSITYNLHDGINDSGNPDGYTIETPTINLLPATRLGYTFDGWYDGAIPVVSIPTGSMGNRVLDAMWSADIYFINYNLNGGNNDPGNPASYTVEDLPIILSDANKTGYTFDGWYDGAAKVTTLPLGSTGDKTLDAHWTINTHTLTYTAGAGGTISGTSPQTVNYGGNGTAVTAVPDTGYHFVQWSDGVLTAARTDTGVTGDISVTASYAINTYILTYTTDSNGSISGTTPQTVNYGGNGTAVTAVPDANYHFVQWGDGVLTATRTDTGVTGDFSVTAQFSIDQSLVIFDSQGGSAVGSQWVDYGGLVIEPASPSQTGCIFAGWYKESDYINQWLFASDTVTSSTTLYAKWQGNDPSFDPGLGFNSYVHPIAIQSDDRILAGGFFTSYDGTTCNRIVRLNTDGSIDSTFDSVPGVNGFEGRVEAIKILSGGKILIGGSFSDYDSVSRNRIALLNPDGTLDASFNPGSGVSGYIVQVLAIQKDDKILIGGQFDHYNSQIKNNILRVDTAGTVDASFGGTGTNGYIYAMAIQNDNNILIGGEFTTYNGTAGNCNHIARVKPDGSLDTTFIIGGGPSSSVYAIAIQDDGKILIGGSFTSYNGTARNRIARLNEDGILDASFNPGTGASNFVRYFSMQSDDKIIICGAFTFYNGTGRNRIARLNVDGSLDASLNPGTGADNTILCTAIQSNGHILLGGDFINFNGLPRKYLTQILP